MLKKVFRKGNNRAEWALVSKDKGRVLEWFGKDKPGEGRVANAERRVNYYKHHS